ncbi:transposase [Accumulibacter sp.]|uniref:REP-associated tyrosine transposase n=1 Tax=Accumulibacter sp. TaxID=2053492 RepID=UPI001AC3E236|nr:transposase [Accumulibacter sp.]MBN8514003.1 transposase [Accumulibacter sp.]MBO3703989.1 transposase [Accumulibacter sp.]
MPPSQPHAEDLRQGRCSQSGQVYLLTLVTAERARVFEHFTTAHQAARCFNERAVRRYGATLAFVVMPDHVHWLLELASEVSVSDAVRIYRAKVSLSLGRRIWQKGFHDRAVRRDEDLAAVARYVVHNPVRAGLVERLGDYPHWDAVWI